MSHKIGVRAPTNYDGLSQYEFGVLKESKKRSKEWLMLNHSEAYKHLKEKNLVK